LDVPETVGGYVILQTGDGLGIRDTMEEEAIQRVTIEVDGEETELEIDNTEGDWEDDETPPSGYGWSRWGPLVHQNYIKHAAFKDLHNAGARVRVSYISFG
jgi:hypothetical protein